jgi:hypothetical protein
MSRGENQAICRLKYILAFMVSMLISCPMLLAAEQFQLIYLNPDNVNKSIGSTFSITVMYDVTTGDNTLTGVGIRIHYDSTKLSYINSTNLAPQIVSLPLEKYEDPEYSDQDATTDRMIVIAWADRSQGNWPDKELPCELAELTFKVKTLENSSNTLINTGFTSVAAGYSYSPDNASIFITTMPTVKWTETSMSIAENSGSIKLTAQLSYASTEHDIIVPITLSGAATPLTDYNISSQTLTFPAGTTSSSVTITVVDDLLIEDDEVIEVKLGTSDHALTDSPDTMIINITNDDEGHFSTPSIVSTPQSVMFYGDNFLINGEPAEIGDEIGVFDPDGILCGRAIIESRGEYTLKIFGDDLTTNEIDEGAEADDVLLFKVWDMSSDSEYTVTEEMFIPEVVFDIIPACLDNPPRWPSNNAHLGLNISIQGQQIIPLRSGWNLFSFSVKKIYYLSGGKPTNKIMSGMSEDDFVEVTTLGEPLGLTEDHYFIIRSSGSYMYGPTFPDSFNSLKSLAVGQGYWIFMKKDFTVTLSGMTANSSDTISLDPGWHLVGCWNNCVRYREDYDAPDPLNDPVLFPVDTPMKPVTNIPQVFSTFIDHYQMIRDKSSGIIIVDNSGNTLFDNNVIKYIAPGHAYWIFVTKTMNFHY